MNASLTLVNGKLHAKTEYSNNLIDKFRRLAGKWDKAAGAWVFPATREAELRPMFGSGPAVTVRVRKDQLDEAYQTYEIGAYVLASRRSRDHLADLFCDLIAGEIPPSGGSVKNPAVKATDDAVFECEVAESFAVARGLEIVQSETENSAVSASALADVTTDDLLAELARRGVQIAS